MLDLKLLNKIRRKHLRAIPKTILKNISDNGRNYRLTINVLPWKELILKNTKLQNGAKSESYIL